MRVLNAGGGRFVAMVLSRAVNANGISIQKLAITRNPPSEWCHLGSECYTMFKIIKSRPVAD